MSSSESMRIGLIGVAHRADIANHWDDDDRASIVAGADINDVYLNEFRSKYEGNDPFITKDYRQLLHRDDVDAIGVFSPDHLHAEHTIAALEAGKHVYMEKPMAVTTEDCDRILEAWEESDCELMVGMNMRYMDKFRTIKHIIGSGEIGELKAAWVRHFVGYGGHAYYHDYRANSKDSTSLLLQKGSHDIDMIHFLTGRYTQRVCAMGALDYYGGDRDNDLRCPACPDKDTCPEFSTRDSGERKDGDLLPKDFCAFRKEVDVEDHSMLIMDLGDMRASYLQCHYTSRSERNYLFIGTEGEVELSDNEVTVNTAKINPNKARFRQPYASAEYDVGEVKGGHGGADPKICKAFLDMVLDGKEPDVDPVAGRMAVAVGCAATESLRNGSVLMDVEEPE